MFVEENLYHSEPMANFLQVARFGIAGILILMSSWVFITNLIGMGDGLDDGPAMIHYLYTFVGYGLALLVLMLTPAGLIDRSE